MSVKNCIASLLKESMYHTVSQETCLYIYIQAVNIVYALMYIL